MIFKNGFYKSFHKFATEFNIGKTLSAYAMGWTFLQLVLSINDLFSEWFMNDLSYDEWIEKKKKIYKKTIDFVIVIIISVMILKLLNKI